MVVHQPNALLKNQAHQAHLIAHLQVALDNSISHCSRLLNSNHKGGEMEPTL